MLKERPRSLTSIEKDELKPECYYGAQPEQLDPKVRNGLSDQIIPSTSSTSLPITPNFFIG